MQSSIAWYRRLLEVEEGAESLLFLPSEACELTTFFLVQKVIIHIPQMARYRCLTCYD